MIKNYKKSYFSKVQTRVLEYLQFNKSNKEQIRQKMVGPISLPKKMKNGMMVY